MGIDYAVDIQQLKLVIKSVKKSILGILIQK